MKSKIEAILYKHSERVGLYEGDVITCVDENEFDDIAVEIVKLFTIPAVSNMVCQHQKRQWIPELNKDLCLNCGELV